MGLALAVRRPMLVDTFRLPKRIAVLHPQLATRQPSGMAWGANATYPFGGYWTKGSTLWAEGESIGWEDVYLPAGLMGIKALVQGSTNHGIGHVYHDGVDTGARLSFASTGIVSTTWTQATAAFGELEVRTYNGSGGRSKFAAQQLEIVDLSPAIQYGTGIDSLPWFGDAPPIFATLEYWNGSAWVAHVPIPVQDTAAMWGSYIPFGHANQWRATIRFWCPQGTHTLPLRHRNSTAGGTITATLNGAATTPGTFSTSAGGTTYNNATNLTFTAATTGMQELRLSGNGGVACNVQWISWRKTVALGAITPTGQTYGVESLELYPWFADVTAGVDTVAVDNRMLHYGYAWNPSNTLGDSHTWNIGVLPGAYKIADVASTFTNRGVTHWSLDAAPLGTVDHYHGSFQGAVVLSLPSAALGSGALKASVDSTNGSANYRLTTTTRLERIGV